MPARLRPWNDEISIDQACAVPFRRRDGQIEFCLITSTAGRWKFPKGFVDEGESYAEAALKEALEEAGLHGRVVGHPIGSYAISKKGRSVEVVALLMEVLRADDQWEECGWRERCWVSAQEAFRLASEREILDLLAVVTHQLDAA